MANPHRSQVLPGACASLSAITGSVSSLSWMSSVSSGGSPRNSRSSSPYSGPKSGLMVIALPAYPALCRRLSPVRAQSDIPVARCERGEAGAGDRVAGSRATIFSAQHIISVETAGHHMLPCRRGRVIPSRPSRGWAAWAKRAAVRRCHGEYRGPTTRQRRDGGRCRPRLYRPRLCRRLLRPAPKARRPRNGRCLRPRRNSRRACRAGCQGPAPCRSRGRGSRRPCPRHCWNG